MFATAVASSKEEVCLHGNNLKWKSAENILNQKVKIRYIPKIPIQNKVLLTVIFEFP